MSNSHAIFLIAAVLLLTSASTAYSDHGSGGGGCSGDCTPPTLGEDNSGNRFVSEGFGINNKFVDVDDFQQDVPTQTVVAGEPVEVTVRIYENQGPHRLSHVGLTLGLKTEAVNGVNVDSGLVEINWDKTFDQQTAYDALDKNNFVENVTVTYDLTEDSFGNSDILAELTFSFTPVRPFDTSTIMVKVWDYDRNSWTNHFYNALSIVDSDKFDSSTMGNVEIRDPEDGVLKIPSWIKLNAKLWSQSGIDDATFLQGIKYCIENKIMNIPNLPEYAPADVLPFVDLKKGQQYYLDRYYNEPIYKEWFDETFPEHTIEQAVGLKSDAEIPSWVKNNAELWADGAIADSDFVRGIEYLVENGIIIL